MALVYNEVQTLLRESAKGFLRDNAPVSALRELRDSSNEKGYREELWQSFVDMGWTGIVVEEAFGGLGFGYVGAGILCEEAGRTLAASPLLSSALICASLLSMGGTQKQKETILPSLVTGEHIMALAHDETTRHRPDKVAMTAKPSQTGFVLDGLKVGVIEGHIADSFLVATRSAGDKRAQEGISLFHVDANSDGVNIQRSITVDSRHHSSVKFSRVFVDADNLIGRLNEGFPLLQKTLDIGAILTAAEALGISQEVFERTLQYLKERHQFGQLIGSFQGLQHRAAQLYCEIELTKSAVLKALQAIEADSSNLQRFASIAKAQASTTVRLAVNEAVQMHGGIGMTDEFDIGFFMKRASVVRQYFGDEYYHKDRFAQLSGY